MTQKSHEIKNQIPYTKATLHSYVIGFILSLILTFSAYFLTIESFFSKWILINTLALLAVTQMVVQLLFFLHLGEEKKPRWNILSFLFMALVVVILVCGSLWIMYNLDTRLMPKESHLSSDQYNMKRNV